MERLLGQADRPGADVLVGVEPDLLEHRRERRELDLAVAAVEVGCRLVLERVQHVDRDAHERVGVVVHVHRAHVRLLLLPVQPVHVVLGAVLEVDRLLVEHDLGRELVHLADDLGAGGRGVDDHDVVGGQPAQRDALGRERVLGPERAAAGPGDHPVLLEHLEQLADVGRAEPLAVRERQLEEPGLQVAGQDEQVVGVDQRLLRRRLQEVLGVADDELVERRARRDEDGDRAGPPAGPAQLLPRGRDGARVADHDRRLQRADVDAELQRVRADHPVHLARTQPGLDLAPVQREVAGAVAAHPPAGVEPRQQRLAEVAEHHLDLEARAAEHDRLHAGADPRRGDALALQQ